LKNPRTHPSLEFVFNFKLRANDAELRALRDVARVEDSDGHAARSCATDGVP
jgi:hypothetical protein